MANLILDIVEGPDAPRRVRIGTSTQIGRDPAVDLALGDEEVSRRHALIRTIDGEAVLEDLGSSNGTFVNARRVTGPQRLAIGDELMLGVSVILLRSAEQIATSPPAPRPIPPALAAPARRPTYLETPGPLVSVDAALAGLTDGRTKARARLAPFAISLLAVLVVLAYLATR